MSKSIIDASRAVSIIAGTNISSIYRDKEKTARGLYCKYNKEDK